MLKLENVTVAASNGDGEELEILNKINLSFETGKMYAITGPNGGGKSSLAKVIMGIYQPAEGRLYLDGKDITSTSITERALMGIGYAFQNPPRFKGLKVKDLLSIAASNRDHGNIERLLRVVGLCPRDYIDREADARLSGGEFKRLEIAMLLARNPRFVIYDEPEAGVDLWTFEQLLGVIAGRHKANASSTTVVITHNERFLRAADEIVLMAEGEVKERGSADAIWPMIEDDIACRWRTTCGGELDEAECYR
ncbi:MAG TPA: ATP-binding cassette domain-containing protein [Firmicutes bacterium]|nr:ATP-binding cassette domain-containing protein [Bacillota bacterium]